MAATRDAARVSDLATGARRRPDRRSRPRLADAGLPPLPRTRLARDRPRRAASTTWRVLRAAGRARRPGPAGRQGRRLRPRRGPDRAGARGRRRRRPLRGHARRGARAARWRRPRPDPRALSDPGRAGRSRPRGARIAVTAGDVDLLAELAAAAADIPADAPLDVELEVETGLGRGGFAGPGLVDAARTIAGGARIAPDRPVDPPPGGRGRRARPSSRSPASRRRPRRLVAAGVRCRAATSRRARPCWPAASAPTTGSGPALRSTASSPTSSTGSSVGDGGALGRPAPGHVPPRPPGPGRRTSRPGGGSATARPSEPPDRAGSPRCRSATATAGRARFRTGPRARARVRASRSSATSRWTPSWST